LLELAIGLAALDALLAGLETAAGVDAAADDAAPDDAAGADDPMTAEAVGGGPLLPLFEVHALNKASVTQAAVVAVATARRWW
jgi:hypothetical protein